MEANTKNDLELLREILLALANKFGDEERPPALTIIQDPAYAEEYSTSNPENIYFHPVVGYERTFIKIQEKLGEKQSIELDLFIEDYQPDNEYGDYLIHSLVTITLYFNRAGVMTLSSSIQISNSPVSGSPFGFDIFNKTHARILGLMADLSHTLIHMLSGFRD